MPPGFKLTLHSWRVSCATRMCERGISYPVIYAHVGWKYDDSAAKDYCVRSNQFLFAIINQYLVSSPVKLGMKNVGCILPAKLILNKPSKNTKNK